MELWERMARFRPHQFVKIECDGIAAERFTVDAGPGSTVVIEATLPDDFTALPIEADEAMLTAAEQQLSMPRRLAANAWRVMRAAHLEQ